MRKQDEWHYISVWGPTPGTIYAIYCAASYIHFFPQGTLHEQQAGASGKHCEYISPTTFTSNIHPKRREIQMVLFEEDTPRWFRRRRLYSYQFTCKTGSCYIGRNFLGYFQDKKPDGALLLWHWRGAWVLGSCVFTICQRARCNVTPGGGGGGFNTSLKCGWKCFIGSIGRMYFKTTNRSNRCRCHCLSEICQRRKWIRCVSVPLFLWDGWEESIIHVIRHAITKSTKFTLNKKV